jgi:polyribonucleotide nucleotidyltransferase
MAVNGAVAAATVAMGGMREETVATAGMVAEQAVTAAMVGMGKTMVMAGMEGMQ